MMQHASTELLGPRLVSTVISSVDATVNTPYYVTQSRQTTQNGALDYQMFGLEDDNRFADSSTFDIAVQSRVHPPHRGKPLHPR